MSNDLIGRSVRLLIVELAGKREEQIKDAHHRNSSQDIQKRKQKISKKPMQDEKESTAG